MAGTGREGSLSVKMGQMVAVWSWGWWEETLCRETNEPLLVPFPRRVPFGKSDRESRITVALPPCEYSKPVHFVPETLSSVCSVWV